MSLTSKKQIKVTTKMLEFILTQVEKEHNVLISDVKDIHLNNDNMYLDLYNGKREVVTLHFNN